VTLRAVTLIMAAVVGLTFLFGFGNVWTLALRLGVPPWVAPLGAVRGSDHVFGVRSFSHMIEPRRWSPAS
jgi:hypothetical protein